MGLQFFPRGGSAHVARNLARTLPGRGLGARLLSGSLTVPGRPGDAREFYAGLDVRPVDMTAALGSEDPMRAEVPLHPSYEDRPGAPDRVFAALDDEVFEHHAARVGARARGRGSRRRRRPAPAPPHADQRRGGAGGARRSRWSATCTARSC